MTTVRQGRDEYLSTNGFSMDGYTKPTFELPMLGRNVSFPNPPARQRAIARHDLHHAITGYGTDYTGEAEIGIWELRAGCNTAFLWLINGIAVAIGVFISPRRIYRAWRDAAGTRSLYVDGREYEELLELDLEELRKDCGVPRTGIVERSVQRRDAEHAAAH